MTDRHRSRPRQRPALTDTFLSPNGFTCQQGVSFVGNVTVQSRKYRTRTVDCIHSHSMTKGEKFW